MMIPHLAALRIQRLPLTRQSSILKRPWQSQTRCFATPSTTTDPRPPIALNGLDGTYAVALYTAAVKSQTLENTAKAITSLKNLYLRDRKLAGIMEAPSLNADDKSAIIAELQKYAGEPDKVNIIKNFMKTLAENNRLNLLQQICLKFEELMRAARGEIEVTVISAMPLDIKTLNRIETAVSKSSFVGQGKKLRVKNTVKSDIIGGLVVEFGDRTIDLSVSSKVAKINKLLTDTL